MACCGKNLETYPAPAGVFSLCGRLMPGGRFPFNSGGSVSPVEIAEFLKNSIYID